ncbi:hypothetical protein EW026_g5770 [Hermanssonia centrifuga]|uniref:Uncharacterized protein n=1 Tax=Hermanssonia centrifuga TaxID=98765 RepID=A0A4S4KD75_9APHY|nr:hypothetical protein EW026_g5770 [Hermanssonia centrifuga]
MSSTNNNHLDDNLNVFAAQLAPEHHTHQSSDVLPGARGVAPAPDYSADNTNDSGVWEGNNKRRFGAGTDTNAVMAGGQHNGDNYTATDDADFEHDERPMNVKSTGAGGVAIDGRDDLPEGHAKLMDKVAGKTQKVAGKLMHKPEMHEKGELREAGGKEAAAGRARAPHD